MLEPWGALRESLGFSLCWNPEKDGFDTDHSRRIDELASLCCEVILPENTQTPLKPSCIADWQLHGELSQIMQP